MTSGADLFQRACDEFIARVRQVRDDQWHAPTPCTRWTVRDLTNHVVNEHRWAPLLLAGKSIDDVGDALDGDLLGAVPASAAVYAAAEAKRAAAAPDVTERIVHVSSGDRPGEEYLWEVFGDTLIHTWDLAAAVGVDPVLPADLVVECAAWWAMVQPTLAELGVYRRRGDDRPSGTRVRRCRCAGGTPSSGRT